MAVSIAGLLLVGVFFFFAGRSLITGFQTATVLVAFSATAAFTLTSVGGLTIGPAPFAFGVVAAILAVRFLRQPFLIQPILGMPSVIVLLAICAYAVLSAIALPRLFQGQTWVFSMARDAIGVQYAPNVPSRISLLAPSSSNISQPLYLCLSGMVFISALFLARARGLAALDRGILLLGAVNLTLGTLDLIGLDPIIDFFQTANYAILDTHVVAGVPRIIGGTPEASVYAPLSICLGAYCAGRYMYEPRVLTGTLAAGNIVAGLLALSTTGLVALAGVILYAVVLAIAGPIARGRAAREEMRMLSVLAWAALIVGTLVAALVGQQIVEIFEALVLNKATSQSGVERGAWAAQGLRVGVETFGLGAGVGSIRANGLVSAWFGSMGVPGLLLLLAFLGSVLLRSPAWKNRENQQYWYASSLGLIALLAAQLSSATSPDPGSLFMLLAAVAVSAKQPQLARVAVSWSGEPARRISPALGASGRPTFRTEV